MRKLLLLAALAALASVALIATATASEVAYFSAIAKTTNQGPVSGTTNRYFIKGSLLQPGDRDNRIGHFRAVFSRDGHVRAVAYLHDGKIKADGRGKTLRIIGGTRHWAGADGTITTKNLSRNATRLTFDVDSAPTKTK